MSRLRARMKNPRWWVSAMFAAPLCAIALPLVGLGWIGGRLLWWVNATSMRIERGWR